MSSPRLSPGWVNFASIGFAAIVSLASLSVFGADERFSWKEPFSIQLPEPARTFVLHAGNDPLIWASDNGLQGARVYFLGDRGSIVEVPISDERWQRSEDLLCAQSAVSSCETAVCQAIQFSGEAQPGSQYSAERVQARLVRNKPEDFPVVDGGGGKAGSCQGPALLPPLQSADGGALGEISLDLSVFDTDPATKATVESKVEQQVEPQDGQLVGELPENDVAEISGGNTSDISADVTSDTTGRGSAKRGLEILLNTRFTPSGGVSVESEGLPDDTTNWTLVVGAGCSEVRVPLDALEPAKVPRRVVALVNTGTTNAVAATHGLAVVREITLDTTGETLAVFATSGDIAVAIAALALDARVTAPQPEYIYRSTADQTAVDTRVVGAPVMPTNTSAGYSDPYAALTYGPVKTGALELHAQAVGSGHLIAVIDTGVEVGHVELAGRIRGEPVDVTGFGWSDDVHGTAVAGIIAANANNAEGIYGVAPEAELLAVKACQPEKPGGLSARCWTSTLIKALDVAMSEDAAIINMSLSGPPDDLLSRYVSLAVQQDRLLIAGAGNGGPNGKPGFPAAYPGVMAVTAVDAMERPYREATRGDYVDVAAPGVDIVSPAPDGRYPTLSGTSMAAAHASGVAALIKELVPVLSSREIASMIKGNTLDLGVMGRDPQFGRGLIDACSVAQLATADAVVCSSREQGEVNELP